MLSGVRICNLLAENTKKLEEINQVIDDIQAIKGELDEETKTLYKGAIVTQIELIGYRLALHEVLELPLPGVRESQE